MRDRDAEEWWKPDWSEDEVREMVLWTFLVAFAAGATLVVLIGSIIWWTS